MSKWTSNPEEQRKILKINQELSHALLNGFFLEIELANEVSIKGRVSGLHISNNAGRNEQWQYSANITMETKNLEKKVIDFLDIKSVFNITSI